MASATVTDLAARALRRIGVAIVPASTRPGSTDIAPPSVIVAKALRDLGINPVATQPSSPSAATTTIAAIAAQTLRALGVNAVAESDMAADTTTITITEIAARALRGVGVNLIAESNAGSASASRTPDYLAQNALKLLGINPVEQANVAPFSTLVFNITELGLMALQSLGVYASDETASDTDQTLATQYASAFHYYLVGANAVRWTEAAVPTQVSALYVEAICAQLGPSFGKPVDLQTYAAAVVSIAKIANSNQYAQSFALDHIAMVHSELAGLNLVNWDEAAIPDALSETYSKLAAFRMAPAFGQAADQAVYDAAISTARTYALSGASGQALAEGRVTSVHEYLAGKNLVAWAAAAIPARVAEPYVTLTMQALAPMVKASVSAEDAVAAENAVRIMALSGAYGQTLAETKVTQAHEDLNARGLVAWTSSAIPTAAADAYAMMAEMSLASAVGKAADAKMYDAGASMVRDLVLSGAYATAFGTAALTNVHDGLVAAAVAPWAITAIPAAVAESYTALVSAQLAPTYNKAPDPLKVKAAGEQIASVVMIMGSQPLAEQVLREIHAEWRDRDMTRWELFDIPRSAEESYISATGIRLAPQFPGARSMDSLDQAEARLYRVITLESTGEPVRVDYF